MKPLAGTSLGEEEEEAQGLGQGRRRRQRQRIKGPSPSPRRYVHDKLTPWIRGVLASMGRGRQCQARGQPGWSIISVQGPLLQPPLVGNDSQACRSLTVALFWSQKQSFGVQILSHLGAGLQHEAPSIILAQWPLLLQPPFLENDPQVCKEKREKPSCVPF